MIHETKLPGVNAKITADTCGTAMQKTISVKVNCEMDIASAKALVTALSSSTYWLEQNKKNCKTCDHFAECPEREIF